MKKEILKKFVEQVWNQGNIEAVPKFISDTYKIVHDPGDPWEGAELNVTEFQNRVAVSRAPIPDQCFDIQEMYENTDSVCITWLWSGTHLGEISGMKASGKTLHMSGATIYSFLGEKISGHWQIADRLGIFQQMQMNQSK